MHIRTRKFPFLMKFTAWVVLLTYGGGTVFSSAAQAQTLLSLPVPGAMLRLSPAFNPTLMKGLKIFPEEPFRFDFIIDAGHSGLQGEALKDESTRLIRYFLAALTVPESDLWVNLSPYEKDRIVPESFGVTEMGRDLLMQDYILKQLTASLIHPDTELGKIFWDRVYKKAQAQFGTTHVPVNTFNKVWIVPQRATIYENKDTAFITDTRLKVMLEEDYVALNKTNSMRSERSEELPQAKEQESATLRAQRGVSTKEDTSKLSSDIIREVIIPEIEKEVNEGKNFAQLRQIYYAMVLAVWYKQALRESILTKVYADQQKVAGIDLDDKDIKEKIYAQYLEAFKRGVYNFIKEDYDPASKELVPRKYFSGGFAGPAISQAIQRDGRAKDAQVAHGFLAKANLQMALPGETATGKMKQIGQRKKDAPEQDLSQFHGAWAKAAAKTEAEEIVPGVTARVIVEPAAMFNLVKDAAYYFHSPKYGWIIVLNDTLTYEIQQEAIFHEAIEIQLHRKIAAKKKAGKEVFEEEFFGEHGIHVIASAIQRKKFSTDGRLTPYDESQLKGMSLDGLKKLAQEYEDGREWHKEVFQRWKTIDPVYLFSHVKIADSLAYDEEFYAHALAYEEDFYKAVIMMIDLQAAKLPATLVVPEDQLALLAGDNLEQVMFLKKSWKEGHKDEKDEVFNNWIQRSINSEYFLALLLVYDSLKAEHKARVFNRVYQSVLDIKPYNLADEIRTIAEIFKMVKPSGAPADLKATSSGSPQNGPPSSITLTNGIIQALSPDASTPGYALFNLNSSVETFFAFMTTPGEQEKGVARLINKAKKGSHEDLLTLLGIYTRLKSAQRETVFHFIQEWVATHDDATIPLLVELFGLSQEQSKPFPVSPASDAPKSDQPKLAAPAYINFNSDQIRALSSPQTLELFDSVVYSFFQFAVTASQQKEDVAKQIEAAKAGGKFALVTLVGIYSQLLDHAQREAIFRFVREWVSTHNDKSAKILAEIFGLSVPATSATAAAAVDWTTAQPLTLEMKRDTGITVTADFIVSQDKKSHDVILLDARTGKKISTFQGHKNQLYDAAFSADKKLALTFEYVKGEKSTVRIWETATGKEVAALPHDSFVYKGVFSPDGKWVVTSQSGVGVQVWDLKAKKIIKTLAGDARDSQLILFSPDGRRLVTSGINTAYGWELWDMSTFTKIPVKKHVGDIFDLDLSADGKTLAVVYRNGRLALWDTESGALSLAPEKIHKGLISTVKFSSGGQWLVTSSLDNTAVVWDVKKNTVHHVLKDPDGPVYDASFSSDGKYVVTGSGGDHSHVRIWETQTGKLIKTLSVSGDQIGSVTFSSDDKNVIAKGDGNIADVYAWQGQDEVAVQAAAPVLPTQPAASAAPKQINISEQDVLEKVLDGNHEYLNMAKAIKTWLSQKAGNKDGILGLYIDEALQGLKIDLARLLLLYNDLDPGQQQRVFAAIQTLIAQNVPSAEFLAEIFGLPAPASAQKEPKSPAAEASAQSAGASSSEKILQAPSKIDVSSYIKKQGGPKGKTLSFYIKDINPQGGSVGYAISSDLETWDSWDTKKRTDFFRILIWQAQHGGYLWELLYLYNHLSPAQQKEVFETAVMHVHEGWDQHGIIAQVFGWDQTIPGVLVFSALANMPQIPVTLNVSEVELAELLATFKEVEVLEKLKQEIPDEVLTAPGKVDIEGNSKYRHTMAMASSGGPWLAYFILVYNKLHLTEKRHVYNQAFFFIRKASAQQRPQAEFVAKIFGLNMPAGKTVSKAGEPAPQAKTSSAGAKAPAKIDVSHFITKHQGKDFWNINEGSVQALIDFQAEQDLWANMDDPDEKSGYFEHKLATAQKGDFQDLLDLVAVYNDYLSDEQQAQVFAAVKAYVASGGAVGKMLAKLFGLPGPAELVQPQPASKQPAPAKLNIVAPEVHKLFFKNADLPTITQAQQDIAEFKSKLPDTKARQNSLKEWLEGLDLEYLAQEYLQEDVQFIIYRMSLGELLLVYNDLQPAEQSQVYTAFLKIIEAGAFGEEYLAKVTGVTKLPTKGMASSKFSAKPAVPAVDWTRAVPLDWGLPKNQGIEITPDFIVTQDPQTFAVTLRDTGTGQVISTFKGHTHTLYHHGIAFSADKKLAVTFQYLMEDNKLVHKSIVRVWETATGKEVAALEHKQHVYSAAFSVDGKYLVTGEDVSAQANQGVVNVWDLQTKTIKKRLPTIAREIKALLFSSDGQRLVSWTINQANGFNIWDMPTLAEVPVLTKYEGEVFDAALSPDGKSLAVSYRNGTMAIWSTENGAQVVAPQALHKTLSTLSFSPDGNWIVIASWDMKVTVWDVKKQQVHKVLEGHTGLLASGIAFTADSKYVATSSGNSISEVMIWEVQSGNLVKKLTPDVTHDVTFSADGKNIIVKASGHNARIYAWQAPQIVSAAGPDISPSKIKVTDAQVAMVMGPLHHPQGVMVVKEEIKHFTSLPKANQRAVIEATLESIEDSLAQGTWTVDARFGLGKMLLFYNQLDPDYQFYLTRLVMNWVDSGGPESAVLAEIFGLEYKEEPPAQPVAVLAEIAPAQIKDPLYDIYQLFDSPHMSPPQIARLLQKNLLAYQTGTEKEQTKLLANLIELAASGTRGGLAHLLFFYNYVSDVDRERIFNFLSDMMAKSAWPQNIADFVRKAFSATPQAAGFPQEIHFTFEEAWQELLPGMDKDQLRYMLMDDWQQYEKLSPNQQKAKVSTLMNLQSKNGEVTPINALKLLNAYNLLPSVEKQKVFHFLQAIISKQHVGHEYFARVLKKYSSPAAQGESMGLEFNPGYDIHTGEVMEFLGNSKDKFWAYDSVVQGGILTSSNTLQVSKLKKYLAAAASEDAVAMAVLLYLLPFVPKEYQTQILNTAREWVALGRAGGDVLAKILKFSSGPPQPKSVETVQPVVDDKSGVQPDDRAVKILASVPEDLREYFSTQPLAVAYIYPFLPASAAAEFVVFWLASLKNGASLAPLVLGELYPFLHKSERAEVRELLRNDFQAGKKNALIAMGKIVSWLDLKKDRDWIYRILIKFAAQQIPGALIGLGHAIAAPGLKTLDPQRKYDAIRHLFQLARDGNDAAAVGLAYARKALTDQESKVLIDDLLLFDVPKNQHAFFEMLGELMPEMSSVDRDRYFNDYLLPAAQNFNHAALQALGEVYHVLSSAQQDQTWAILQQGVKQDKGPALIAVARIYQRTRTEYEKKQSSAVEPDSVAITLDSSLKDLGLFYPGTYPNPFYNFLEAAGIDTVGDLIEKTEGELLAISYIGPKSIEIIKQKLKAAGGWTLQGAASPAQAAAALTAEAPFQIDMLETEIASAFLSVETDSLEGLIFTNVGELWAEQKTLTGKSELVERLLQNDALYSRLSLALLIQLYPLLGQSHKVETTALIIRWVQEGKPGHEALAKIFNIKTAPAFVFSDAHFDPKKAKEYAQAFLEGNPTLVELFAKFSGYYVKDEGVHDADIAKAVTQLLANFNKPSHVWLAALAALYNDLPRELQVKVYAFMRKWIEEKKPGYQKLLLLKFDDKASEPAVAAQSPTSVGERIADLLFADDADQGKKYLDLLALYYSADANGKEKIVDMCVKKIRNDPRSWEPHFWGVLAAVNNTLTSTQKDIVYPLLLKAAFHEGPSPELLRQALAKAFFSAQFELPLVIGLNDPLLSEILNDKEDWQEFLKLRQEMAPGDILKLNVDHIIHLARDGDLVSLVFLLDSYARLSFDQKKTVYKLAEDLVITQEVPEVGKIMATVFGLAQLLQAQPLAPDKIQISEPQVRILLDHHQDSLDVWEKTIEAYTKASFITIPSIANTLEKAGTGSWLNLVILLSSYQWLSPDQKDQVYDLARVLVAKGGNKAKVLAAVFGLDHLLPAAVLPGTAPDKIAIDIQQVQQRLGNVKAAQKFIARWNNNANGDTRPKVFEELKQLVLKVNSEVALMAMLMLYNKFSGGQKSQTFKLVQEWVQKSNPHAEFVIKLFGIAPGGLLTTPEPSAVKVAMPLTISFKQAQVARVFGNGVDLWKHKQTLNHYWSVDDFGKEQILEGWMAAVRQGAGLQEMMALVSVYSVIDAKRQGMVFSLIQEWVRQNKAGAEFLAQTFGLPKPVNPAAQEEPGSAHRTEDAFSSANFQYTPLNAGNVTYEFSGLAGKIIPVVYSFKFPADLPKSNPQLQNVMKNFDRFERINFDVLMLLHKESRTVGDFYEMLEAMRKMVKVYLHLFKNQAEDPNLDQVANDSDDLAGGRNTARIWLRIEESLKKALKSAGDLTNDSPLPEAVDKLIQRFDGEKSTELIGAKGAENYTQAEMEGISFAELINIVHQKGVRNLVDTLHKVSGAAHQVDVKIHLEKNPHSAQKISVNYYDARQDPSSTVAVPALYILKAFAKGQLIHQNHKLFDPEQAVVLADEKRAIVGLKLGYHSARIQFSMIPVQEGGRVQINYTDSGEHYDPGSSIRIKALAKALEAAGFKVNHSGYVLDAYFDKDTGAVSIDQLPRMLEFAVQLLTTTKDVDLGINAGPLRSQKNAAGFLADLMIKDGYLQKAKSKTKSAGGGPINVLDNLSNDLPVNIQHHIAQFAEFLGLDITKIKLPIGQRFLDLVNERFRLLLDRGAIIVTAKGEVVKVADYERAAKASPLSALIQRLDKMDEASLLDARRSALIARTVQDFSRRQIIGSIGGYLVEQLVLPALGDQITFYVLKDGKTGEYDMAWAVLGEFFYEKPRFERMREEQLPHNELSAAVLQSLLRPQNMSSSESLKKWLRSQKISLEEFETKYQESVFKLMEDQSFLDRVTPSSTEKLSRSLLKRQPVSPVAFGGVVTNRGVAIGKAVLNNGSRKASDFVDGILISQYTESKDDDAIKTASGIVVTSGGPLSHSAVRAQEHKKPALILNGALVEKFGLVFKIFKGTEQKQTAQIKGQKIAYAQLTDYTQEDYTVEEGDLLYLDAQNGLLYVLAKASDTAAVGSFKQYQTWKGTHLATSTVAGKPVDKLRAILLTISNVPLLKAIINDLIAHELMTNDQMEKLLRELTAQQPGLKEAVAGFINQAAASAIEDFKSNYEIFKTDLKTAGIEQLYLMTAEFIAGARALQAVLKLAGGNGESGLSLEQLRSMVDEVIKEAREQLVAEKTKLVAEVQGVKTVGDLTLLRLLRIQTRVERAGLKLAEVSPAMAGRLNKLRAQREAAVQKRIGRGIIWKEDLLDRFARPLAGGKGANSGEILNAIKVLQAAGRISSDMKVVAPAGFVIQPQEYHLWQEAGEPAELDAELKNNLTIAYRDLVLRQYQALKELISSDMRSGEDERKHILEDLVAMEALDETDKPRAVDAIVALTRKLINTSLKLESFNAKISKSLRKRLLVLGSVAVRSSGLKEDSEVEAMAGMKQTVLNVTGTEALYKAVVEVWRSRADGVLVEEMINAKSSLLGFSADSATKRIDRMKITSAPGLAKGLVDQTIQDPDTYTIKKRRKEEPSYSVLESHVGEKTEIVQLDLANGGTQTEKVAPQSQAALSSPQIQTVAQVLEALSEFFGYQVDMEASFDADDRLVILQVRPITTLRDAMERGRAWLASDQSPLDQANGANGTKTDRAMLGTAADPKPVGGINLDPAQLNLERKGTAVQLNVPADPKTMENLRIEGLTPFIFQMVPITNLPMVLGSLDEEKSPAQRELLSAVN